MTRRSVNEIRTTVQKAAVGSGLPPGIAEDVGRAAAWLSARGLDGVGAALAAIGATPGGTHDAGTAGQRTRVVSEGVSALDQVALSAPDATVKLSGLDAPALFLGLAANAAADYGLGFEISFGDGGTVICSPEGTRMSEGIPDPGCDVTITAKPDSLCDNEPLPTTDGVVVDDKSWAEAAALAAKTYVPSTEASRLAGAGAGLTDND